MFSSELRVPTSVMRQYSLESRRVVAGLAPVGLVLAAGRFAQVDQSVIESIAVDVIDNFVWPTPVDIKPNDVVKLIVAALDPDHAVSTSDTTGDVALPRPGADVPSPAHLACARIVLKKVADHFCGDSHGSKPHNKHHPESEWNRSENDEKQKKDAEREQYVAQRLRDIERFEQLYRAAIKGRR